MKHAVAASVALATFVAAAHGCGAFSASDVPAASDGGATGDAANACIPHDINEDAGAPDASCGGPGRVDLSSSPGHCGVCNHSCQTEACETGQCHVSDVVPFTFVPNNPPGAGALRAGILYMAQAGIIYQAPATGGSPAMLLAGATIASTSLSPPFLAHDRLWTVGDQTKLFSFALEGSGLPQHEADGRVGAVATDGDVVYWANADNGEVRAVGNAVALLSDANIQGVYTMAADRDGLFLIVQPKAAGTKGKLLQRDANGQAVRELLSDLTPSTQMTIEGGHVYWADTGGAVWRMEKATLQKEPVTQVPANRAFVKGLVVDAENVFVVTTDDGNGGTVTASLHVASKCGGPARLLRSDTFWGGALLADAQHLYWSHSTAIARMAK
ncbi:MAG: hypothetical protein QOI41_6519 [Myxococcales bacterium]|nr:hypothetical protein [Myxococcales bacterium]